MRNSGKIIGPAMFLAGLFYKCEKGKNMQFFQFNLCTTRESAEIATPLAAANPEQPEKKVHNCTAIWDTGATSSMISASVAKKLNLCVTGKTRVSGVHGIEDTAVYYADLIFGNGFVIPHVRMSEAADNGGFDILIGMDIIGLGEFYISGCSGKSLNVCFTISDSAVESGFCR